MCIDIYQKWIVLVSRSRIGGELPRASYGSSVLTSNHTLCVTWANVVLCVICVIIDRLVSRSDNMMLFESKTAGCRLNIKIPSNQYRNSFYKGKAVSGPTYLYNENIYIRKGSLYVETEPYSCTHLFLPAVMRATLVAIFAPWTSPDPRYWPTMMLADTEIPSGNWWRE